ncbi:hypothetical protein REC_175 [Pseudomonas phage REC]|nr:hypothetical protein REC_175 [Pseudomonas phage REC]UGL62579.1 hypothetical protein [Pseudomonas phage REC1]
MSTPAQQAGFIVNVTRLKISNKEHAQYGNGLVYLLREDDETSLPFFRSECGKVSNDCFFIGDMSIIQDVPAPAPLPAPVAPALTLEKAPLPVPPAPVVYTALQQKAINTFQAMYDAAVAHREGRDSRLNGDYGICDNIDRFASAAGSSETPMSEVKENLIRQTAMYSGNYTYPVPCPDGGDASTAFSRHSNKWRGAYGLNRLVQLEQLIELIKTKWDDSLVNRKTPAFRNGLQVGDVVRYTRRDTPSFWVFRRDDESMSPSFHKLTDKDDYTDIDLNYIVKVDKDEICKPRAVSEFLSELEAQAVKKADIERQIANLQKQLTNVQTDIAMLDYGLADQHKVKRIA